MRAAATRGGGRLSVAGLRVLLDDQALVDGVALEVAPGEIVGVAGESGSGKTVSALALLGLLPPRARTEGSARLGDLELLALRGRALGRVRGRRIAMVSQDPMTALHPMLSVERQLSEHVRHHLRLSRSGARARALELLRAVALPDPEGALRAYPHQFSGGMRQRIAIAMALACEPQILIADEPTTALDVTVQAGILRLLDRLRREGDLGVLLITHDLGVLSSVADRLVVFYAGRVAESGPTARVLDHPRHPYTRALLDALPHPDQAGNALVPIPGVPPSPAQRPGGCAFHPRCPHARPACVASRPAPVALADGRLLACPPDPFGPAPGDPVAATR